MKILFYLLQFVPLVLLAQSQDTAIETSDKEALVILEAIQSDYDSYNSHLIEFGIVVEFPGEAPQKQKGKLLQVGDKFELDIDDKLIISDDLTVWLYLKDKNEVQINDADFGEEGEYMSPNKVFNLYKSKDYVFAISQKTYEEGKAVTLIECKSLNRQSEYSKIRLTIIDQGNKVKQFKLFSKDGSRFTMNLFDHKKNVMIPPSSFGFNPKDYPGVIVEDLRF